LATALHRVREAVDAIARLRDLRDRERREEARAHLARGLSAILAAERAGAASDELQGARDLIQRMLQFVDERVDMAHLVQTRRQTRKLRDQLNLCRSGDLPVRMEVWTSGALERRVDWWSCSPVGRGVLFGAMGTIIGDESDAAMVGSALGGALAVARKGIGVDLTPDRAQLVLHATLVDLFGRTVTAPSVTWRLETTTGRFSLAAAGHRSFWHVRKGVFKTLRARPGTPLGVEPVMRARPVSLELQKGDHLFGLSAGVFEVESPQGAALRESDLRVALLQALQRDPRQAGTTAIRQILEHHARRTEWAPQATAFWLQLR
jgi:hypothetical protein